MPNRFGLEEQVAREVERIRPKIARAKANLLGPAPGARNVVGQQEVDMWDQRDPNVDVVGLYTQLVSQGMDAATAQTQATLKAYPNRGEMMLAHAPSDVDEQVKYAEHMARRSQKRQEEQQPSEPPDMMPQQGATDAVRSEY